MDLVYEFNQNMAKYDTGGHDFNLFEVKEGFYLGLDSDNNVVIVCHSSKPNRPVLMQKTKYISVECNVKVSYSVNEKSFEGTVHIVRCFSTDRREREIFIDLSPLFFEACAHDDQEEAILEVVATLAAFFSITKEPGDTELQGLFAELYTIYSSVEHINLGRYWQSKERMKFDFSISDKIKIEVKSTLKSQRIHHFRHEQLLSDIYSTYVFSYLLREDDEGLSLHELIEHCKPLLLGEPKKLMAIYRVTKGASEQRLKELKYNEAYLLKHKKIYRAAEVPQFVGSTPQGVTNAEYDCNLTTANALAEESFWQEIAEILQ